MNRLGARSRKARAAALFAKVLTHEELNPQTPQTIEPQPESNFGPLPPPDDPRIANRPGNPNWHGVKAWFDEAAQSISEPQPNEVKSEAGVESPVADWPVLFNVPAFREFCAATVQADQAERLAERDA